MQETLSLKKKEKICELLTRIRTDDVGRYYWHNETLISSSRCDWLLFSKV